MLTQNGINSLLTALVLAPLATLHADDKPVATLTPSLVLKTESFRHYVDDFNKDDNELYKGYFPNAAAWAFLKDNLPLLDCRDEEIQRTHCFRWWTYRKHIKPTPAGFIVDEFLPNVGWAGKYNSISCAAGHHIYEGRWPTGNIWMTILRSGLARTVTREIIRFGSRMQFGNATA